MILKELSRRLGLHPAETELPAQSHPSGEELDQDFLRRREQMLKSKRHQELLQLAHAPELTQLLKLIWAATEDQRQGRQRFQVQYASLYMESDSAAHRPRAGVKVTCQVSANNWMEIQLWYQDHQTTQVFYEVPPRHDLKNHYWEVFSFFASFESLQEFVTRSLAQGKKITRR